ncbi:MAG: hypothetical protein IJR89_05650, partial [Clostridia bacterium]|nr:hypothetical protein [Clostridia bacterium]
ASVRALLFRLRKVFGLFFGGCPFFGFQALSKPGNCVRTSFFPDFKKSFACFFFGDFLFFGSQALSKPGNCVRTSFFPDFKKSFAYFSSEK